MEIMHKLLQAVNHLHSLGVCHRDLKPENILFDNNDEESDIKLIDFGLAGKSAADGDMTTLVGTPYYVAPEVLQK